MSVRILVGDVFEHLAEIPDESIHCVVTSPPYWGLRDYGTATWQGGNINCNHLQRPLASKNSKLTGYGEDTKLAQNGMPYKDKCGKCGAIRKDRQIGLEPTLSEHLETMVKVFAEVRRVMRPDATLWLNYGDCYAASVNGKTHLQDDARVRSPNDDRTFTDKPMSTVGGVLKPKDLCMIPNRLAIALQEEGWWVRSEIIWAKPNPMPESVQDRPTSAHEKIWLLSKSQRYYYDAEAVREAAEYGYREQPQNTWDRVGKAAERVKGATKGKNPETGRNLRNVWQISTAPYPEAHFATFPPKLAETCIKSGCPEGGTVLDPFGGSGTTGLVADRLKRNAILIELNPEYAAMAERRIKGDAPLFTEVAAQ